MTRIILILLIFCNALECYGITAPKNDPILEQIKKALKPVELTDAEDVSIIYEVPKKDLNIKLSDINDEKLTATKEQAKQEENVEEIIDRAYRASTSGSTETSLYLYKRVLAKEPDNLNAMFSIGSLYQTLGMNSEAKGMYKKVLELEPKHAKAISNYILLLTEENPQKALNALKALERTNPNYAPVLSQLGIVYTNMGDYNLAQKYFVSAAQRDYGNPTHLLNLGIMFERSGNTQAAINVYRTIFAEYVGSLTKAQKAFIAGRLDDLEFVKTK